MVYFPDTIFNHSLLECIFNFSVLIIIPYRHRENHLKTFLRTIHPFLQMQNVQYTIIVSEQGGSSKFNRAKLLNIGFIEAKVRITKLCLYFDQIYINIFTLLSFFQLINDILLFQVSVRKHSLCHLSRCRFNAFRCQEHLWVFD